MKDHSWAHNAFLCSCQRFQYLLHGAPVKVMLDRGEIGKRFWDKIEREKMTARALNQMYFNETLYIFRK